MTVQNPAIALQNRLHPAEDFRRYMAAVQSDQEGCYGAADLKVTQHAGTPNMSVDVAGGRGYILGDSATYQGTYFVENRGISVLTVTAADPTNPRIDRVIAEILDSSYSGASDLWQLRVMAGTPAASPVAPTLPVNSISLCTFTVAAGSSSVLNAAITDLRTFVYTLAGIHVVPPKFYTATLSSGTQTGTFAAFLTQNSILTAPYPLTMVVTVTGDMGANGGANTAHLQMQDEGGTPITHNGVFGADYVQIANTVASDNKAVCLMGHKVYAAGATCGFRVGYRVDTSNIFIGAYATVNFYPTT